MFRKKIYAGLLAAALTVTSLFANTVTARAEESWPGGIDTQSAAAIVMEQETGAILYEKNIHATYYPASITKILTALVALENSSLDEVVTFSKDAVYLNEGDSSHISRDVGEQMTMEQCLYGMLLESANECAYAIAEHVGGSVEGFAALMNAKARDIGCYDTYYITPNGLDAEDENGVHSTTAADLARVMRYCICQSPKREEFLKITRTNAYSFWDAEGLRNFTVGNKNAFLGMMEGALSGKTGFTNNAGYCYVGALERDGRTFIVALLACGWPNNRSYKWSDTRKLMSYGLENYQYQNVWQDVMLGSIPVENGIPESGNLQDEAYTRLKLASEEPDLALLLAEGEEVQVKTELSESLTAPVEPGMIVGSVCYYLNGTAVKAYPIEAVDAVEELTLRWCFFKTAEKLFL